MDTLEQEIKKLIIECLNLEDMTPDDIDNQIPLFGEGLGLDSIDALELGIALKKKFGVEVQEGDSNTRSYFRNVTSLADLVRSKGLSATNKAVA